MKTFKPAANPVAAISLVSYPGQDPKRRMFRSGYENWLTMMPILEDLDEHLNIKINIARDVMQKLAEELRQEGWVKQHRLDSGNFERTIIAIEEPKMGCLGIPGSQFVEREGVEFVVAHWGDNHSSPVHGHAPGFLHEEILYGKMRVNTYRMINDTTVRPVKTIIATQGTFASTYTSTLEDGPKRQALIHNFTSIGQSASLHYVPEHTRDGRDNKFEVEYFENSFDLTDKVTRITSRDGMFLQKGTVVLVRSANVPEYGDHFIVITGGVVEKEHGMRPQDEAIYAPYTREFLDKYPLQTGLTLLKLNGEATRAFHEFHGITMKAGEVVFPNA
jgi:hypothetical protein